MKSTWVAFVVAMFLCAWPVSAQQDVTIEKLLSAPFPENLVAAKTASRVAWTFNEQGKRNVWVADDHGARRLTPYLEDDGQEVSDLHFSDDGSSLVYVRGGGKNPAGQYPDPTSNPAGAEQAVWVVAWTGGQPRKLDAG